MNNELLKIFLNTLNITEFEIYIIVNKDYYSIDMNFSMEYNNSVAKNTYSYRSSYSDNDNTIFKVLRDHFDKILDAQQTSKFHTHYPSRYLHHLEQHLLNLEFVLRKYDTSLVWTFVKKISSAEELINLFEGLLNIKKQETIKKFKDMYE
jgi:hypothetical protein